MELGCMLGAKKTDRNNKVSIVSGEFDSTVLLDI